MNIWISWVLGQRQNNQWNDQYATIHTSEHRSKKRGASWLRKLMAAVSLALDEHFFFYKGDRKSRVNLHGYTSDSPCPVSYTYPHGWTMTTSSSRINPFGLAQSKGFFFFSGCKNVNPCPTCRKDRPRRNQKSFFERLRSFLKKEFPMSW